MTVASREIDLGTHTRDRGGRYAKVFTLSYEMRTQDAGEEVKVVRHLPAAGIERIGRIVNQAADCEQVWNVEVLDSDGTDCTFDFECFQS